MADERVGGAYIEIGAERDRGEPKRTLREIEGILDAEDLDVDLGLDDGYARRALRDFVSDAEDMEIDLPVDVDTALAASRLHMLSRTRIVDLIVKVNGASMAKAATALAAISGGRSAYKVIDRITDSLLNLDKNIPALATLATAVTNVSSVALAGTSNILGLGSSLASIAPAALALPGIFAGFGVGAGVMIAALKDTGKVLGDLGPKFSALQDQISENFWAKAEEPIRGLVDTWLPSLSKGFSEIATELGYFGGSLATALSSADNVSHLDSILASVRDSIDIAGEGIAHFADAMMGLVDVGASYLPELAGWFNRVSESFSSWVEEATNSGEIFGWIDAGIAAMQDLGRVVWGLGGIFGNLARAATNAGGASLGALADGLENVNAALEGPVWQGALTTVFQGAHDAMEALGPGVSAVGDAFISLAPTLAQVMTLGGQVASVALQGISAAFQNPAFQGGLVAFFEGVLEMV